MPRSYAIVAAVLLAAFGSSTALAGEFTSRATSGFAAIGDDPRGHCPDHGATVAMSDSDTSSRSTPATASVTPRPVSTAKHMGVDDVVNDMHPTPPPAADVEEKPAPVEPAPAPPHKAHALRWQSLLPGVMK